MVHVLGTVTLKTLHGAISVLRTGRYIGLCVEDNCSWETPETDSISETDEQLLRHHHTKHRETKQCSMSYQNGTFEEAEFIGDGVWINLDTCTDLLPWRHELPDSSK